MKMIKGVRVKPLKVVADERGRLFEMLRRDDPLFRKFFKTRLKERHPAALQLRDARVVMIHDHDAIAQIGKAGAGHQPDMARADNTNLHVIIIGKLPRCCKLTRAALLRTPNIKPPMTPQNHRKATETQRLPVEKCSVPLWSSVSLWCPRSL